MVQAGILICKIKVAGGIKVDRDRIAAVRAAVDSEVALRIDANGSYDAATSPDGRLRTAHDDPNPGVVRGITGDRDTSQARAR